MTTSISGLVHIAHYTAYLDDVVADDAMFQIDAFTRLVLTGDDRFHLVTLAGAGQLRVRGPLEVDGLTLQDSAYLVNTAAVTQVGAVALGDAAVARNAAGATWNIAQSVDIGMTGANARFVNLGLFEQTGHLNTSTLSANFYNRGGAVQVDGMLDFVGPITRFIGGSISGIGRVRADGALLDGVTVSLDFRATTVVARGDDEFSGLAQIGAIELRNAHVTFDQPVRAGGGFAVLLPNLSGAGVVTLQGVTLGEDVSIDGDITVENAYSMTWTNAPGTQDGAIHVVNGHTVRIINDAGALWSDQASGAVVFDAGVPGGASFDNQGTFEENSLGGATMSFDFNNDGLVSGSGGLAFLAPVTGVGVIQVRGDGNAFDAAVASTQSVQFVASATLPPTPTTLTLGDVAEFAATISGFAQPGAGDDVLQIDGAWTFDGFVADAGGGGGSLLFSESFLEAAVRLDGDYDPVLFQSVVGERGIAITYG